MQFHCNGTGGPIACGAEPENVDVSRLVEAGGGVAWEFDRPTPTAQVGAGILVPFDHDEGWPVLFVAAANVSPAIERTMRGDARSSSERVVLERVREPTRGGRPN